MPIVDIIGEEVATRVKHGMVRKNDTRVEYSEEWHGPIPEIETKGDLEDATNQWDSVKVDISSGVGILLLSKGIARSVAGGGSLSDVGRDTADETQEDLLTRWDIISSDLQNDLRTFAGKPEVAGDGDFTAAGNIVAVTAAALAADSGDGNFTSANQAASDYYNLRIRGTESFLRTSTILQKTVTSTKRSLLVPVWKGTDRAHSIFEPFANGGPDPPGDIVGQIKDMPDADTANILKQWLKRAPQIRIIVGQQQEIVYTWMFAQGWSNVLYAGQGSP